MALSRPTPVCGVIIDGVVRDDVVVLNVTRSMGSRKPDSATIQLFRKIGSRSASVLQDKVLADITKNSLVEITITNRNRFFVDVHFGRISRVRVETNKNGEVITATSRMDESLFGDVVDWVYGVTRDPAYDSRAGSHAYKPAKYDGPVVFNPIVDGNAQPNRLKTRIGNERAYRVIDPDMIYPELRESERRALETLSTPNTVCAYWSLVDVVEYLCWTLNGAEDYINNPTSAELQQVLNADPALVRNLQLRLGDHLPKALDSVLTPLGYQWLVELDNRTRRIKIIERGKGLQKQFKLQKWGELLDVEKSQVPEFDLSCDFTDGAFNELDVIGGWVEVESSFELRPGWEDTYDSADITTLTVGSLNWETDTKRQHAFRRFVWNEAGDYTGLRPWWNTTPDLAAALQINTGNERKLDRAIPRRRRFHPMLSRNLDGTPLENVQGCYLEYWNPDTEEWLPIRSDNYKPGLVNGESAQLLKDEMGIEFRADQVPYQLVFFAKKHGIEHVKLRLTATVRLDYRLRVKRTAQFSLLQDTTREIIDRDDDYKLSRRLSSSRFNGVANVVTSNGRDAVAELCIDTLRKNNAATIEGDLTLDGVDVDLRGYLGMSATKFDGRNLEFRATHQALSDPRYPTIVAIRWNVQRQKTTVSLDTMK